VIQSMPSKNDGDAFYAPLKRASYEILYYITHAEGGTSALLACLRKNAGAFERLFSCTCYNEKAGT
jgi:hypothetical protein